MLKTSAAFRRRHSFRFSQLELNRAQPKTNFDRLFRCYCLCLVWYVGLVRIRTHDTLTIRCDGIALALTTRDNRMLRCHLMNIRTTERDTVYVCDGFSKYCALNRSVISVCACLCTFSECVRYITTLFCIRATHERKCGWVICDKDNHMFRCFNTCLIALQLFSFSLLEICTPLCDLW